MSCTPTRTSSTRYRSRSGAVKAPLGKQFGEILVPTEEVVEMRDGQKRKSDRKFFQATCWSKWKWMRIRGIS